LYYCDQPIDDAAVTRFVLMNCLDSLHQGSPTWYPQAPGRLRACSKNSISMINVFTLMNINTRIIENKLSKFFISEVYIKLVALRINRCTRSCSQFQKGWWPLLYTVL